VTGEEVLFSFLHFFLATDIVVLNLGKGRKSEETVGEILRRLMNKKIIGPKPKLGVTKERKSLK
jgi:hypothetical protein